MSEARTGQRIVARLKEAWRGLSTSARAVVGAPRAENPDLPDDEFPALRTRIADCLEGRGGETRARARAAELGQLYLGLSTEGRKRFMRLLAAETEIDRTAAAAAARAAISAWEGGEAKSIAKAERALRRSIDSPRGRLLAQFTALSDGVKFLIDRRAELLDWSREDPVFASIAEELRELFVAWFDLGFLELERITWESPAILLERLAAYEAVHAVRDWADLKNRLDGDRRFFAFFHPRMPLEPLIFVEVALVNGLADNVQALLDEKAPLGDPAAADTAIFYSISNAQRGLAGISFGGFLIKRVAQTLGAEYPNIRTFATLSPIPGFRSWLEARISEGMPKLLLAGERKALTAALAARGGKSVAASKGELKRALASGAWLDDPVLSDAMKAPLSRLCVRYLVEAKRPDGRALDPVAHFHLSNGARVERLNWRADTSTKGIRQSAGLMVNYLYRLVDIEANHEAYAADGKVAASSAIKSLL